MRRRGATSVEYALVILGVAAVIGIALFALGHGLARPFTMLVNAL